MIVPWSDIITNYALCIMNLSHHPTVVFFEMLKNQPWAGVATVYTVGEWLLLWLMFCYYCRHRVTRFSIVTYDCYFVDVYFIKI